MAKADRSPRPAKRSFRTSTTACLCPIGHSRLRAALWMPLLAAVRRNPWLKAFYDRLISRGKLPKVALVAALRKLLGAVFADVRDRKPFVPRLGPAAA